MKPSVAARIWHRANLEGDTATMAAMRRRCPDVESRCISCGHVHSGPSIVGPRCKGRAITNGHGSLIAAAESVNA